MPAPEPAPEQQYEYYDLDDQFNLTYNSNLFLVTISNVSKENTIVINDEEKTSSGVYIIVAMEAINSGKEPQYFEMAIGLNDINENLYTALGTDKEDLPLQPGLKTEFYYIFEVPADTTGLKLSITDENTIIKVIDLEI